ncbi:hypothetical protein HK102_006981 [Quaeritorhiza haematococci]|nr:hypothetical protein HK102_006981 [Quaeritorhiza haematococci]
MSEEVAGQEKSEFEQCVEDYLEAHDTLLDRPVSEAIGCTEESVVTSRPVEDEDVQGMRGAKRHRVLMLKTTDSLSKLLEAFTMHSLHRVIVFDPEHADDDSWYTIVTQTDLLNFINLNSDVLPDKIFSLPASAISQVANRIERPLLTTPTADEEQVFRTLGTLLIPQTVNVLVACRLMYMSNKSCIGIVEDETGKLVGNISGADFRGFDKPALHKVLLPVGDFIREIHKVDPLSKTVTCAMSDPLAKIINGVLNAQVHRAWVVDEANRPLGVATMTDILTAFQRSEVMLRGEE